MIVIVKKKGKTKDALIRELSRAFNEEQIADITRKRQYYKRPSQVNKEKRIEQIKKRAQKRTTYKR